jgi:hypothetical protein
MTEDEFWMATKQMMTTFIDTTVRSLYTEITVLSVVLEAIKKSRPEQALIIENLVQMARDSEDTKRSQLTADIALEDVLSCIWAQLLFSTLL